MGAKEEDYETTKDALLDVVARHFRPEFVNRIDEVVVFHPLTSEQIKGIALFQLALLNKRLAEQELEVDLTSAVLATLAEAGFDPVYGARPLKRALQQRVENPLAHAILNGDFVRGDKIKGDMSNGRITFSRA
jgi:ATP-dependent Clp protease ATP-binding subunit ClpB